MKKEKGAGAHRESEESVGAVRSGVYEKSNEEDSNAEYITG